MRPIPAWLNLTCRLTLLVLLPVVFTLTNVRLLLTPYFPDIEYRLPGFPPDLYGFTQTDRLQWSKVAIAYLLNNAGIQFLSDLRFPAEQTAPAESCKYYTTRDCTYLYNDRELAHMLDVKRVTQAALWVWRGAGSLALAAALVLYASGERTALRAALLSGAAVTFIIYLGISLYIAINFNALFVQFHQVFFASGTWIFLYSDTLIRLFPVRFWQDAFIFIGASAIVEASLTAGWAWFGLQ